MLKIELNGALSDQKRTIHAMLLGEEDTELSLTDILKAIKEAKNSDNIKGIYIEAGNFRQVLPVLMQYVVQ